MRHAKALMIPLIALTCFIATARAGMPPVQIQLQVSALETLHGLNLNNDQLKAVDKLAGNVTPAAAPVKVKMSDGYRTALSDARDALLMGDEDKIRDAEENLQTAADADGAGLGIDLSISDSARHAATDLLAQLRPSQVAIYIADHAEDVPDPLETIKTALDAMTDGTPVDYDTLKDDTAQTVAIVLAGLNQKSADEVTDKVTSLLNEAHKLKPAELKAKRPAFDILAGTIVKSPDPMECIRHWLQHELADLMTNPELKAVLAERLKNN